MPRERPITNWEDVPVVFDVPYAARLFGFTADIMSRKCAKGEFPAHKIFGKWRINKDEAIEYFLKQGVKQ